MEGDFQVKNIIEIVKNDFKEVFRKTTTWIIIIGLMLLPSIYAWPNILASWDPYGHTNNIKVAVVSEDTGGEVQGKNVNIGQSLIDGLKNNKNLNWQFVSSKQEAEEGVRIGDYYASIVVPKNFSEDITSVSRGVPKKAQIEYTVNEKINAISPKITNSGASALANTISKSFIETANGIIFEKFHEAGIEFEANLPSIEKAKNEIFKLNDNFTLYESSLADLISKVENGQNILYNVQGALPTLNNVASSSIMIADKADTAINNIEEFNKKLLPTINEHLQAVANISKEANDIAKEIQNKPDRTDEIKEKMKALDSRLASSTSRLDIVKEILNYFNELSKENILKDQVDRINNLKNDVNKLRELNTNIYNNLDNYENIEKSVKEDFVNKTKTASDVATELDSKLNDNLTPLIEKVLEKVDTKVTNIAGIEANNAAEFKEKLLPIINEHIQAVKDVATEASEIAKEIQNKPDKISELKERVNGLNSRLESSSQRLDIVKNIFNSLNSLTDENLFKDQIDRVNNLQNDINKLREVNNNIYNNMDYYDEIAQNVKGEFVKITSDVNTASNNLYSKINNDLAPLIDTILSKGDDVINKVSSLISQAQAKLPEVNGKISDAEVKVQVVHTKLLQLQKEMPTIKEKISKLTEEIKKSESDVDLNSIFNLLQVDYKEQAEFFANPVQLQENKMYPIANYGSAMTPFYTVLSIWVGSLLMSSLLTTKVEDEENKYKPYEKYLGRWILFLIIALFQAMIVTTGDIHVLGAQAVSPYRFVLYGMLIAILFSTIIYTLVSVLGNIGKVVAIVLLVLQIGSSGGTFPIQMTSSFFQTLYPKMPFTYSISLLREAVGGAYMPAVQRDLKFLIIGIIIALAVGLILVSLKARSTKLSQEREKSNLFL